MQWAWGKEVRYDGSNQENGRNIFESVMARYQLMTRINKSLFYAPIANMTSHSSSSASS
jgi:hypothetical protein